MAGDVITTGITVMEDNQFNEVAERELQAIARAVGMPLTTLATMSGRM